MLVGRGRSYLGMQFRVGRPRQPRQGNSRDCRIGKRDLQIEEMLLHLTCATTWAWQLDGGPFGSSRALRTIKIWEAPRLQIRTRLDSGHGWRRRPGEEFLVFLDVSVMLRNCRIGSLGDTGDC